MGDEDAYTEYGNYGTVTGHFDPRSEVLDFLGEFADDYDVDGLTDAFAAVINSNLPDGWVLAGRLFFGPYPMPADAGETIRRAVNGAGITDEVLTRFEKSSE